MADDDSTVELDSSLESEPDFVDTSDEETSAVLQKLRFHGESDSDSERSNKRWWWNKRSHQPLSVQSGDIVHSNESAESNGCLSQTKKAANKIYYTILRVIFFHEKVPIVSVALLVINVIVCCLLIWAAIKQYPPDINISLRSFTIPNHPAQKHSDAFAAARARRYINATSNLTAIQQGAKFKRDVESVIKRAAQGDCLPLPGRSYQYIPMKKYSTWNVDLVYRVRDNVADKNLLTKERLSRIQAFENSIYNSSGYSRVCYKKPGLACDRLTSLMTSLYPTKDNGKFVYTTQDGFTPNLTASLLQFKNNPELVFWYTGGQVTIVKSTNQIKAKLLRAQISVGLPLPCFDSVANLGAQKDIVWSYYQSLIPLFEGSNTGDVEVLYGGTALYDYQVNNAELHDALLAIPSFLLILVVIFVLSGFSLWLTVMGLYSVFSCFPWAFFVYRVVLGIETLNVLNIISLFVVIGIGVDDVFVFINTFKQSAKLKSLPLLHQRLGYTILTAGKATFVTSLTTSVAFFANAISVIPAVKQFGIFMGLVVICCYFQVLIVLPLSLHIWHCFFRYLQNIIFYPCSLLCRPKLPSIPALRMSDLENENQDVSGMGNGNGVDADSLDTEESESAELVPGVVSDDQHLNGGVNGSIQFQVPVTQLLRRDTLFERMCKDVTSPVTMLTSFLQTVMLHCIARPLMFFQFQSFTKSKVLTHLLRLTCVWVYSLCLILSVGVVFGLLRFTDRPPQIFNSHTNIQKMLDLAGNLSEGIGVNCAGGCGGGSLPYIPPPTAAPPSNKPSTAPTPPHSPPPNTHGPPATTGKPTPPPTQPPLTTRATPPNTHPQTQPPPTTHPPTKAPPTTHPPTNAPHTTHPPTVPPPTTPPPPAHTTAKGSGSHITFPPVTDKPTVAPGNGEEYDLLSSLYSNNEVVNVVFGIKGVVRMDGSSELLSDGDHALQEDSFYGNFTCSTRPGKIDLTGTMRALCRICNNISNPDNGLIMRGNFNCFPSTIRSKFSCLNSIVVGLPECWPILNRDHKNVSVAAVSDTFTNSTDKSQSVQYAAMAFRSTTNPNESPSEVIKDYQHWEDFLSKELSAIKEESGPGKLYEGADGILSSAFQTTSKWVEANIEAMAVDGSLYGICVSVLLCLLIIVFLTHNWRVFFAIKLTVLNIIFSLLAMFVVFGWKLGIVEAITLTIVVGNSLDYCIHLCEGYMSASPEHIAYVEQFKFLSGASIQVKRVAVSISSVGVSIMSSAITTVLATIPMLFTTIELFTRFGQILLLNTLLAISYTLIFCSTFLALFGPSGSKFTKVRALNAVITITVSVVVYPVLLVLVLYILSLVGIPILSPEGHPLF